MSHYSQQVITIAVLGCLVLAQLVSAMQLPTKRSNCVLLKEKPRSVVAKHSYSNCLIAEFGALIQTEDGQFIELKNGVDCEPEMFKCQCGQLVPKYILDQQLTIDFSCGSLSMWIGHNETSPAFVREMNLEYQVDDKIVRVSNKDGLFPIDDLDKYYKCDSEQAIKMSGEKDSALLLLSSLSLETYRGRQSLWDFYKQSEVCIQDTAKSSL